VVFNTEPYTVLPDNSILNTANMQPETGFPSSHQLKPYVASKSRLKLAAHAVLSADAGLLVIFRVSRRRRKMYCGHAHLCVCLSAAACPHYCMDPDVTWGSGRGCPPVVHYWADLQSVHGLRCYGNITRTLVTSLRPSRDMTRWCERSVGSACAVGQ